MRNFTFLPLPGLLISGLTLISGCALDPSLMPPSTGIPSPHAPQTASPRPVAHAQTSPTTKKPTTILDVPPTSADLAPVNTEDTPIAAPVSSSEATQIVFGFQIKDCYGHCFEEITLSKTQMTYKAQAYEKHQNDYPTVEKKVKFKADDYETLLGDFNLNAFKTLAKAAKCDRCGDAQEWVELAFDGSKFRVNFNYLEKTEKLTSVTAIRHLIDGLREIRKNNPDKVASSEDVLVASFVAAPDEYTYVRSCGGQRKIRGRIDDDSVGYFAPAPKGQPVCAVLDWEAEDQIDVSYSGGRLCKYSDGTIVDTRRELNKAYARKRAWDKSHCPSGKRSASCPFSVLGCR